MGRLFCIMGKSASGKDTLYRRLLEDTDLGLSPVVLYTTRPIRTGETDGVTYHFVTEDVYRAMKERGEIIEERVYHTVFGDWYYFTADDGRIDLASRSYLTIGTLESLAQMRAHFGEDAVEPLYIQLDDGERLARAVARERIQKNPGYEELCRRFLADQEDFSEDALKNAGIGRRFFNGDLEACTKALAEHIKALENGADGGRG